MVQYIASSLLSVEPFASKKQSIKMQRKRLRKTLAWSNTDLQHEVISKLLWKEWQARIWKPLQKDHVSVHHTSPVYEQEVGTSKLPSARDFRCDFFGPVDQVPVFRAW